VNQAELFHAEHCAEIVSEAEIETVFERLDAEEMVRVRAETAPLDALRERADHMVEGYTGTKRPTFAPALTLDGELVSILRQLGWLETADKDVARLWARYSDPRRGPVRCSGFELRAGQSRSGKCFFETMRDKNGSWQSGPRWRPPRTNLPEWKENARAFEARWATRYPLAVRAVELGAARVADFAGHTDVQMQIGGTLTGACQCCGRALTDPISLERGIGPECWGSAQRVCQVVARLRAEGRI
jgi:hypothetical protein